MTEQHICLACDDTVSFEIVSVKKIFYGYIVKRECPLGHMTAEHRGHRPYERT